MSPPNDTPQIVAAPTPARSSAASICAMKPSKPRDSSNGAPLPGSPGSEKEITRMRLANAGTAGRIHSHLP
jgi:hypothetical protein